MLKLKKQAMLIAFLAAASLVGCKKKTEEPIKEITVTPSLDRLKFQKIERFISIVWKKQSKEIKYDEINKKFLINGNEISLEELERVYDLSNEYKLNHEK